MLELLPRSQDLKPDSVLAYEGEIVESYHGPLRPDTNYVSRIPHQVSVFGLMTVAELSRVLDDIMIDFPHGFL